jgi:multicomponent Na+:H+ antiporter subunit D
MNLTLESMLQLSILLPLVATVGIVAVGRRPNLREAVTIGTSLILFYFVIKLYHGLEQGEVISVHWWQLVPGLRTAWNAFRFSCQLSLDHHDGLLHWLYA